MTIHGVEDSGETPFIVMELIQGETLRDRIRREPKLDLLDSLRISSQVAQGLAAAHAQGIIHRDVKPGNIMLLDLLRVKIADFGLARVATENVELTSRGVAVGTPAYMSPEQVRGEELDARSDLFAMGCVMYAMFAGHSPFHGRTALETAMRIETHHPVIGVPEVAGCPRGHFARGDARAVPSASSRVRQSVGKAPILVDLARVGTFGISCRANRQARVLLRRMSVCPVAKMSFFCGCNELPTGP